jgi:uncharacterized protein (TIGR03435 family)
MIRGIVCLGVFALFSGPVFRQTVEKQPSFDIADVHPSPARGNVLNQFRRGPFIAGGRYELLNATVLDLIQIAYSPAGANTLDADKVAGGPDWMSSDRFDVIGKVPPRSSADSTKIMLQTLLSDRFKLVIHNDTRPLPAYALSAGKKPLLKQADGSGETGCKLQTQSSSPAGGGSVMINLNGTTMTLGINSLLTFACRNITMQAFAEGMPSMIFAGSYLNNNRVVDKTDLKGSWNFDLKFSLPLRGPFGPDTGDTVTLADAIQKQLGLDLVMTKVPTPVIAIDSVNQKPTPNPPGIAEALPPLPEEFEVADVKPTAPDFRGGRYQVLPSGRVDIEGLTLRNLIQQAWQLPPLDNNEALVGPKFLDTARFTIVAKAPTFGPPPDLPPGAPGTPAPPLVDQDSVAPMLRNLLIERFGLTFHTEQRPLTSFTLTSVKPKLQKADPSHRTGFHEGPGPDGKDPRVSNPAIGRLVTCENMTMAQFAANLPLIASGYIRFSTVVDATGLEGAYDFTLAFSGAGILNGGGGARGAGPAGPGGTQAAEPNLGITLYEAIEKQLGLRLEQTRRPGSVMIIDHIEEKPKDQ